MALFDLFKKKETPPKAAIDFNKAKPSEDLEHLDENGELPFGWTYKNKDFVKNENSLFSYFLQNWLDSKCAEPKTKYEALKSFVTYLEDAEKICKSKGECFEFWFYEILTSKDYLQKRKDELADLTANFDEIETNYKKKENELANLDAKIVKMLKDNPNIIQSDFVKMFDDVIQSEVKEKLYYMDKIGVLERIKVGRSYTLNYRG